MRRRPQLAMKRISLLAIFCALISMLVLPNEILGQDSFNWLSSLPQAKDYIQKRASSYDRSGGNADARSIAAGEPLVLLEDAGRGSSAIFGPRLRAMIPII